MEVFDVFRLHQRIRKYAVSMEEAAEIDRQVLRNLSGWKALLKRIGNFGRSCARQLAWAWLHFLLIFAYGFWILVIACCSLIIGPWVKKIIAPGTQAEVDQTNQTHSGLRKSVGFFPASSNAGPTGGALRRPGIEVTNLGADATQRRAERRQQPTSSPAAVRSNAVSFDLDAHQEEDERPDTTRNSGAGVVEQMRRIWNHYADTKDHESNLSDEQVQLLGEAGYEVARNRNWQPLQTGSPRAEAALIGVGIAAAASAADYLIQKTAAVPELLRENRNDPEDSKFVRFYVKGGTLQSARLSSAEENGRIKTERVNAGWIIRSQNGSGCGGTYQVEATILTPDDKTRTVRETIKLRGDEFLPLIEIHVSESPADDVMTVKSGVIAPGGSR